MTSTSHHWRFFRAGGFDQVRLDTAADLLHLHELDQKLWVALSCPVQGIEFDRRTLAFIDTDADGHVRAPELLAAIAWAAERLATPEVLAQQLPGVPLAALNRAENADKNLLQASEALREKLQKSEHDILTVEECSAAQAVLAERAQAEWQAAGAATQVLGTATPDAWAALQAVADKVEDFFVRCQLAAFDARAGAALNAAEDSLQALAAQSLQTETEAIAHLPLAHISAAATLPLDQGLNPAWCARMATLRDVALTPLLGARTHLTLADWRELRARLAPYGDWLATQPDAELAGDGVRDLEKLARYVRDLLPLANNFVAFKDFYTRQGKASFQIGTLYLDGRSCELCVAVSDAAAHATLATLARICLVYCECRRGNEKLSIAAAFTAGDADQLMVGRNGVFYDRQGRDWDASIVKLVEHPISLRQAFWSPYKQLAKMVGNQLQKIAASKAQAAQGQLDASVLEGGKKVATAANRPAPTPNAPPPFDVGKFAGIFAAIGLAVGAIGTALASVITGLFALHWWQIPLAFGGLMLAISGPAVLLAAFKLGSRNLGPILDANGWAINARARINIPFGTSLTQLAQLPAHAERSLSDPYAEQPSRWPLLIGGVLVVVLIGVFAWIIHKPG